MIVGPNLPFHQEYFSNAQNLQNLRSSINSLISNDIQTLQSLLSVVQKTLSSHQNLIHDQLKSETYKKEKELELFKYLSEQNRDRSDTVTGLAQFIIKMIDFIEEQHHRNQSAMYSYQRKIDQLTDSINQLAYTKSLVENDIQTLRQQLQQAQIEIDKLIQQRNYFNENQLVSSELKEELHNFKIQLLENQLNKLKTTISCFNNHQIQSKKSLHLPPEPKSLKYTYSLDHFALPKSNNICTEVSTKKLLRADDSQSREKSDKQRQQSSLPKKGTKNGNKGSRSPKKAIRYLTERQISQEHIDECQMNNLEQQDKFQGTCLNQASKASYFKKNQVNEMSQLQLNSQEDELEIFHRLCSDMSHKSFVYQALPQTSQFQPGKLIYITEDEDQNKLSSIKNFQLEFNNMNPYLETRESEISMKDTEKTQNSAIRFQNRLKDDTSFMCKSMIVPMRVPKMMNASVVRKEVQNGQKQQTKGICQFLSNFIVTNRVKRTTQKANSGLNRFLI